MSKNSRKNQVVNGTIRQLVSRISTDASGKVTGKWNGKKVIFINSNIWQVAE